MAKVIVLEEYRHTKAPPQSAQSPPSRPRIRDGDIWARNYRTFEGLVAAILTLRELLGYHLHYSEEWKHYALALIDNAFQRDQAGSLQDPAGFRETLKAFKTYVAEETTILNREDFNRALLVLELIERNADQAPAQQS
jgi:hypothetical protein